MRRFIFLILLCLLGITSVIVTQEPPPIAQYRGNAQRDGYYPAHGVPFFSRVKWELTLDSPALAPLYADETLYIPTIAGELIALDSETGDEKWRFRHGERMTSTPAIAEGVIYFGGGNEGIYALDAENGELLWSFTTDSAVWSAPPVLFDNTLYTGSENGTIYAIDLDTHEPVWMFEAGEGILWSGAADNLSVYFSTWTELYALDRLTGEENWRIHTRDKWMSPAVSDGIVYAGNGDNEFLALDSSKGEILWRFRAPRGGIGEWSAPVISEEAAAIYVGHSSSTLFALDRVDGSLLWDLPVESWATSDALFDGGLLYFGVGAHGPDSLDDITSTFYVVRNTTGEVYWTYELEGLIHAAPALSDVTVYVVTTTGKLYAFDGVTDA